jgi:hypothetical protein
MEKLKMNKSLNKCINDCGKSVYQIEIKEYTDI